MPTQGTASHTVFIFCYLTRSLSRPIFDSFPLAAALTAAIALTACNTAPTMMPMGTASASSMATPDQMGKMDAQMK